MSQQTIVIRTGPGQLSTSVFRQLQERWWWLSLLDRLWWHHQQQRVPLLGEKTVVCHWQLWTAYNVQEFRTLAAWGFLYESDTCRCASEHVVARAEGELVGNEGEKLRHREDHVPEEVDLEETVKACLGSPGVAMLALLTIYRAPNLRRQYVTNVKLQCVRLKIYNLPSPQGCLGSPLNDETRTGICSPGNQIITLLQVCCCDCSCLINIAVPWYLVKIYIN